MNALTATAPADNKALKVSPRVAEALRLMIEEGLYYPQAAERVGLHVRVMRKAIEKPHVLNYLKAQRKVLRAALCAANDFHLAAIRDNSKNQFARVQAIRTLEAIHANSDQSALGAAQAPGFIVQIVNHAPQSAPAPMPDRAAKVIESAGELQSDQ